MNHCAARARTRQLPFCVIREMLNKQEASACRTMRANFSLGPAAAHSLIQVQRQDVDHP